jgi:hypothetical protein
LATAWTEGNATPGFQENSTDVLIAQLFDKNLDGSAGAGDEIKFGSAPSDFAGAGSALQAGTLPVIGLSTADATQCVVRVGSGSMVFQSTAQLDLWVDTGADTSTLVDLKQTSAGGLDEINLNAASNGQPAQSASETGPAGSGATDDNFLQIAVNCQ